MKRRQRGTGTIFLPEGSSIWWMQYYKNGVKQRESAETSDKRRALDRLRHRIAEVTVGTFTSANDKKVRISELAEDFLRDYRINGKASIDDAEARWRIHIDPFFGKLRASQLTSALINKYVDQRQQEDAANATINRELAALKRMFNLGKASTPPKVTFVPHFPKLAENNVRQGFLEDDQYLRLLESCLELWFQALVEAGCTYGWRIGELLKIKVNQLDIEKRIIRLEPGTTKNKDGREVIMTENIHELLSMCIEGKSPDDYVFTRGNGRRVKIFRGTWRKACIGAGIPDLLFHDLRRTAARNLRRAGIAETIIMRIGGWRTRSMFGRYAIVANNDVSDAVEQFQSHRSKTIQKVAANHSMPSWWGSNLSKGREGPTSPMSNSKKDAKTGLFIDWPTNP